MSVKPTSKNFIRYKKGYKTQFIKDLLKQIEQGESFTLMGMPGIGKTDMFQTFDKNLEFWQELFPNKKIDFLIVLLDLTKLLDISPLGFYRLLLHQTYKVVSKNVHDKAIVTRIKHIHKNTGNSKDIFFLFEALEEIIKMIIEEVGYKLCILIDDFSTVSNFDKQFFNSLKALRNINKWRITLGFSSDRDLLTSLKPDVLDELYDVFSNKQFWLKPISKENAFLGMEEWEKERGIKISKEAKNRIFAISGGHAGYMRALSRVFFDSDKDISVLSKDNIKNLANHNAVWARSEKLWDKLLDSYKESLIDLLRNPDAKANHRAKYLENTGVITTKDGKRKLFSPLLEYFIEVKTEHKPHKAIPVKEGMYIDPKTETVYINGKILREEPTKNEYKILQLLYKNKGEIVSREDLAEALWGKNAIKKYSDWAIDRTVSRIRKKINDSAANPKYIQTIKGRGLRLTV